MDLFNHLVLVEFDDGDVWVVGVVVGELVELLVGVLEGGGGHDGEEGVCLHVDNLHLSSI